ncbi:MAG: Fe-S cluster assembly sulfur transfer protein SufU [Phycisphaerae bacterium]
MTELPDLYQELILDHNKRPRNRRCMESADCKADGYNPLCGDRITVYLKVQDGVIADISFEGGGCAISTASASLMTQALKGKSVDEANALFEKFHAAATGTASNERDGTQANGVALGKLAVFGGVSKYPARVKCATLAWHTIKEALAGGGHTVSTE